jgi:hypothetical protein
MEEVVGEAIAEWIIEVQVAALNHCGVSLGLGCFYQVNETIFCRKFVDGTTGEIDSVAIGLHHLTEAYPRDRVMQLFREGLDLSWEAM